MPASSSTFQFGRLKRRPLSPCLHLFAGLDLIFVGAGWTPTRSWPWKQLTHGSLSPLPLSRHLGNRLRTLWGFPLGDIVPTGCYYPGMLGCAYSLGLFTDDFLDHSPLLYRCHGSLSFSLVLSEAGCSLHVELPRGPLQVNLNSSEK